jgi:hypothetical protein
VSLLWYDCSSEWSYIIRSSASMSFV